MVITCEPVLYVTEGRIDIRLESGILLTDGELGDLIGSRLLDVDEIETIIAW